MIVHFFSLFFQLAQLLPMEENFLLLFRFDNPLDSSVEFMKVKYPNDRRKLIEIFFLEGMALQIAIW